MAVDILEAVRKRKLRTAKSSISFGENTDRIIHDKAEEVKELLKGNLTSSHPCTPALTLASLYYKMTDEYYHKASVRMPTSPTKKSLSMWTRVVRSCEEANVEPEAYMRAQFSYFHKTFGKPPAIHQLATEGAIERAMTFVGNTKRKIIGNDIRVKMDIASILRSGEKQMQDLCRVHECSRAEVYRKFVLTGLFPFPKEYLEADPVYAKVRDES